MITRGCAMGDHRSVRNSRALAFWVLPPLLVIAVAGFLLIRGEGPMGERIAAIVVFLVLAALVDGVVYRATSNRKQGRPGALLASAAAVVGGLLGAAVVWLSRPDPPTCTTLDKGMRACMPVIVVEPPLWLYGASAVVGALLAGGMAYAFARRARGR